MIYYCTLHVLLVTCLLVIHLLNRRLVHAIGLLDALRRDSHVLQGEIDRLNWTVDKYARGGYLEPAPEEMKR